MPPSDSLADGYIGVIRNVSGGRAAAFAEIYSDPPLMDDFGFDGAGPHNMDYPPIRWP